MKVQNLVDKLYYVFPWPLFLSTIPIAQPVKKSNLSTRQLLFEQALESDVRVGIFEQLTGLVVWGGGYLIALLVLLLLMPKYMRGTSVLLKPTVLIFLVVLPSFFLSGGFFLNATNAVHTLGTILIAIVMAFLLSINKERFTEATVQIGFVVLLGHVVFAYASPDFGFSYAGRLKGAASNANSLARCALVVILFSLWAKIHGFSNDRVHSAGVIMGLVILLGTGSATALVCALAGGGLLLLLRMLPVLQKVSPGILLLGLFLIFLPTIAIAVQFVGQITDVLGKDATFSGRAIIWEIGLGLATQTPYLGFGFSSGEYLRTISGLTVSSFHNGFLDAFIKGGVPALFSVCALIWVQLRERNRLEKEYSAWLLIFILVFLIYNVTESTVYTVKNPMWMLLLAGFFLSTIRPRIKC